MVRKDVTDEEKGRDWATIEPAKTSMDSSIGKVGRIIEVQSRTTGANILVCIPDVGGFWYESIHLERAKKWRQKKHIRRER